MCHYGTNLIEAEQCMHVSVNYVKIGLGNYVNVDLLSLGSLGNNSNQILIEIQGVCEENATIVSRPQLSSKKCNPSGHQPVDPTA